MKKIIIPGLVLILLVSVVLALPTPFEIGDYVQVNSRVMNTNQFMFDSTGTRMYDLDYGTILEWSCSTPWLLSSCSKTGDSFSPGPSLDFSFKPDGTKFFTLVLSTTTAEFRQHSCSVAWDLSTCTLDGARNYTDYTPDVFGYYRPWQIEFSGTGQQFYFHDFGNNDVHQFNCVAWEIISPACSFDNQISTIWDLARDLTWKPDGTRFYMSDGGVIRQWDCSSPWQIDSCGLFWSHTGQLNGVTVQTMQFKPDGAKLMIGGGQMEEWFLDDTPIVDILPNNPKDNEDLQGWVNCSAGKSTYNITYRWYKNAGLQSSGTYIGATEDELVNVNNVSSSLTNIGETWQLQAECIYSGGTTLTGSDADVIEVDCGVTLSSDLTLTADLDCSGYPEHNLLNVTGVTLDCNGYSIIGNNLTGPGAIGLISGANTFSNCDFKDMYVTFGDNAGMLTNQLLIEDSTFDNIGGVGSFIKGPTILRRNIFYPTTGTGIYYLGSAYPTNLQYYDNVWEGTGLALRFIFYDNAQQLNVYNNIFNGTDTTPIAYLASDLGVHNYNTSYTCIGTNIIGGDCSGGNYWNGYAGTDLDGDGIGEAAFPVASDGTNTYYDYLPLVNNLETYTFEILEPANGSSYCRLNNILLDFTVSFNYSTIDSCWWDIGAGSNPIGCNDTTYLNANEGLNVLTVYANVTSGAVVSTNSSFTSTADLVDPVINIVSPTTNQSITKDLITDVFSNVVVVTETCQVDTCWYNHYTSGGTPGNNTIFSCSAGTNNLNIPVDYFGTHIVYFYANDSEGNEGSSSVQFNIVQSELGGGGGGGGTITEKEVPVPFFVREESYDVTCGVDADLDGYICDANEDWISCPDDCEFPSLDELLCFGGDACVWREAWFLKMLFALLLMTTIYLVYIDLTLPPRKRRIFT